MRARVERFTEPAVLLLLREDPRHGYELLERLPGVSAEDGHVDLGNLYRLLRALEAEGLGQLCVASRVWPAPSGLPADRLWCASAGRLGWLAARDGRYRRAISCSV